MEERLGDLSLEEMLQSLSAPKFPESSALLNFFLSRFESAASNRHSKHRPESPPVRKIFPNLSLNTSYRTAVLLIILPNILFHSPFVSAQYVRAQRVRNAYGLWSECAMHAYEAHQPQCILQIYKLHPTWGAWPTGMKTLPQ